MRRLIATFRCTGRLGECSVKTGIGELQVDDTRGPVRLKTGSGDVTVGRASGHVDVTTGSGTIRMSSINGTAVVKNANGETWIGDIVGDLRVNSANGKIVIDQADGTVTAKTANGDLRLREVAHGAIVAETACGSIEIGVLQGVAAWLDLTTRFGNVHNELDTAERPVAGQATIEVRAHTSFGDVTIGRAPARDSAVFPRDPVGYHP